MTAENRKFRKPTKLAAERHQKIQMDQMAANETAKNARESAGHAIAKGLAVYVPPAPGLPLTRSSSDPVAGALRFIIEAAEASARLPSAPRRGRPPDYRKLLTILNFVEQGPWVLGIVPPGRLGGTDRRVGTGVNGKLVQSAAIKMNLSPARVSDLARQLADMAGTMPERKIGS
ncbi:hypothetical protein [Lichenicola sp.]|uniref:hypothetical protein n=1 Tax=Lichenicola sp. TaxID=2804529 RepID=UPI003AFFB808